MTKEQYLLLAKGIRAPFLQIKNEVLKNIQQLTENLSHTKFDVNLPAYFEDECILMLCRFAAVDGVVDENETTFINAVFERNFSTDFIRENAAAGPIDFTAEPAKILTVAVEFDNFLAGQPLVQCSSIARILYSFFTQTIHVIVQSGGFQDSEAQAFSKFREVQTAYINEHDRLIKNKIPATYPIPDEPESANTEPSIIQFSDNTQKTSTDNSAEKEQDAKSSSLEELLEELDSLIGLPEIKKDVHTMTNFIRISNIRKERGMTVPAVSRHLVFTGNPGTGKTTVARLIAKLYQQLGVLSKGQLVETDRGGLVAGYLGQTALKTQQVIREALGGVLFIDEAYALINRDDDSYGKEAIETILKAMEDHRDELVIIVAGYPALMYKFLESNPGLSSRFNKYFDFPDYTGEELMLIFERFCRQNSYSLEPEAAELLSARLKEMYQNRGIHFGNARTVRNIFEKAINAQADRIASFPSLENRELETLTKEDILAAL